ncbi:MAG: TIGR01777 family oxidoreductase [Candidatus Electryonea clarkiae]|nr:TIGR01777 family oxidoreductase [Candidatus Electryonea clarkiae]MDP8287657.1 TIGR01777 family oxidoreductase [Candidatus Electryonea clarkiae]
MNILISGSSGLVGSALIKRLSKEGYSIRKLVRYPPSNPDEIQWSPYSGVKNPELLEGTDTVIHLAGANLTGKRWSNKWKNVLYDSRILGTRSLCESISKLKIPPKLLISSSAVGYYGNCRNTTPTEENDNGTGFLANLCYDWEKATTSAENAGIRVIKLRTGLVISPLGGVLSRMLPMFRIGLGGKIGDGKQFMSWISIDDLTELIFFCINTESVSGPINTVAPVPVTNSDFTKILTNILHRPAPFTIPKFALRLAFGEMADETLLSSQRVIPEKIMSEGFKFTFQNLKEAIMDIFFDESS